jgi:hypothetical protein
MVEEGEQLEGSSLSMEGRMLQAQLLLREPEDPNPEGAMVAGGGGEPPRPQGLAHPKGTGDLDPWRRRGRCRHPLSPARPRRW